MSVSIVLSAVIVVCDLCKQYEISQICYRAEEEYELSTDNQTNDIEEHHDLPGGFIV